MLAKYILLLALVAYVGAASNFKTYTYKTVGDLDILLDVQTPTVAAPAGGYPVFFAIHGGGYIEGGKSEGLTYPERSEAIRRGWVVVSIEYRLMPAVFLQDILEDVQDAYKWVRTELIKIVPINPNLITLFGKSAGGGLSVLAGYKLSPRPAAIIGFYSGVSNWADPTIYNPNAKVDPMIAATANQLSTPVRSEYRRTSNSDPIVVLYMSVQHQALSGWLAVTHDPNMPSDQVMAKLKDLSAVHNVDHNYPPTYLAHGLIDPIVAYSQSVQLADQLKKNNVPYVLDLIPNAKHDFDSHPDLWQQHVLPAFDFAEKHMQSAKKTAEMNFTQKLFLV